MDTVYPKWRWFVKGFGVIWYIIPFAKAIQTDENGGSFRRQGKAGFKPAPTTDTAALSIVTVTTDYLSVIAEMVLPSVTSSIVPWSAVR